MDDLKALAIHHWKECPNMLKKSSICHFKPGKSTDCSNTDCSNKSLSVTFTALKCRKIWYSNPPKTGFLKGTINGFLRKRFHWKKFSGHALCMTMHVYRAISLLGKIDPLRSRGSIASIHCSVFYNLKSDTTYHYAGLSKSIVFSVKLFLARNQGFFLPIRYHHHQRISSTKPRLGFDST